VYSDSSNFRGRKPWIAVYCVLVAAALVLSQARGPWLACLAAVATIALLRKEARLPLAGVLAAGAVLVATVQPLFDRFLSIFDKTHGANSTRFELWHYAIAIFKERPLFGAGPDNFKTRLADLHPGPFSDTLNHTQAHSVYFQQLSERGIVGFAMLITLLGFLWWQCVQRYRRKPEFSSLWLLAAFHAFLVMNLTENSFQKASVWMFVVFLFVWTMRQEREAA